MRESHQEEIMITDISSKSFEGKDFFLDFGNEIIALMEYLYQGKLPTDTEILKELIVYSEKILLNRLKEYCEETLIEDLVQENTLELYELSKISAAEKLQEACGRLVVENWSYFADQFVKKDFDIALERLRKRLEFLRHLVPWVGRVIVLGILVKFFIWGVWRMKNVMGQGKRFLAFMKKELERFSAFILLYLRT